MTEPPPPPFEPPVPVPDGGSGGGGSTRHRLVVGAAVGVVAILVAVLVVSGDDDDAEAPVVSQRDADTFEPIGSTLPEGFTDRAQLEELFTDRYQEELGVSEDEARCLAGHLSEGIEEGRLTEEQAMAEIIGFLEACDLSLEEIGRGTG